MNRKLSTYILLTALSVLAVRTAFAQDPPVFSQFLANPYQFNPSYVAREGFAEANVFFRKQWVGFDNAPEAYAFNIQSPFGRNVALGLQAYANKTILLNTSAVLATFGYKVRLGVNSSLNFGLSAGMGFNRFKLDAVADANDPALNNIIPNTNSLTSQFGLNLNVKNFNFGIALPQLLDPKTTQQNEESPRFNPFSNKFMSASYTAKFRDISITPAVIYRALDNVQFQWEGVVMANWRNTIWLGSSYRDGYGLTFFLGFGIKKLFRVGYAYEHPTGGISKAPNSGTHEVHTGVRLGKYNREEAILAQREQHPANETKNNASLDQGVGENGIDQATTEVAAFEDESIEDTEQTLVTGGAQQNSNSREVRPHESNSLYPGPTPISEESSEGNLNTGHYVVLGVYKEQNNALRQMGYLKQRGLVPSLLFVPEKRYYYVYVFHSTIREEAARERKRARRNNQFFGAWIYTVE